MGQSKAQMGAPCQNSTARSRISPKVPSHPGGWDKAKGRLYVCFSHVAALAKVLNCCDGIVNCNILEGEIVLFNKIIHARGPRLRVG